MDEEPLMDQSKDKHMEERPVTMPWAALIACDVRNGDDQSQGCG